MRQAVIAAAGFLVGVLIILFCLIVVTTGMAHARWKPEYANAPQAVRDWYESRELTPEAEARFHFKSCCNNSDVVKTKFKVGGSGKDEWFWLDEAGQWQRVPDDVIHWNEHAPNGEPVMFAFQGRPTCFYPPDAGG